MNRSNESYEGPLFMTPHAFAGLPERTPDDALREVEARVRREPMVAAHRWALFQWLCYPHTPTPDVSPDERDDLLMARKTMWRETGRTDGFAMGAKTWITNVADFGLVELPDCTFGADPGERRFASSRSITREPVADERRGCAT
jgi:protein involved in temperature-dependent protein secretion